MRHAFYSILLICLLVFPALSDTLIDDFQVNSNFPGHPPQKSPYAVANWETETIYLTWLSQHDGEYWDVGFNRFSYDLEPLGDGTYLNIRTDEANCNEPRLVLSDNGFGAAWIEEDTPNRIAFRAFDSDGNPSGDQYTFGEGSNDLVRHSLSVATLNDGYLLVWYDERDSSKIQAQKMSVTGTTIGDEFLIRPDSTGDLLGVETQNHPDGRVLVSWVADSMYSRGRWLDADGEFMGNVFEQSEPYNSKEVGRSALRFSQNGSGIQLQFSNETLPPYASRYCYLTYLDSEGMQIGDRIQDFVWYFVYSQGPEYHSNSSSFPSFLCINDTSRAMILRVNSYSSFQGFSSSSSVNVISSSTFGGEIFPWGLTDEGNYSLCQLNAETMLYVFSPSSPLPGEIAFIGLRTYEIATLDSSDEIVQVFESDFSSGQDDPDIVSHQNGEFRIAYRNKFDLGAEYFTRYFNATGTPLNTDLVISIDGDFNAVSMIGGDLELTPDDLALIIWPYDETIYGTTFDGLTWEGEIHQFDCVEPVGQLLKPRLDINSSGHIFLVWEEDWWNDYTSHYHGLIHARAFSDLFNPLGAVVTSDEISYPQNSEYDCTLRDNGQFAISFLNPITLLLGQNYDELVGDPIELTGLPDDDYAIENTIYGYVLAMASDSVIIQIVDTDGTPVGNHIVISDSLAEAVGEPYISVSETGNFAVCWQDERFDEGDIFCRQFNSDGSFYGSEYRINSDPVGPLQKDPAVAFGPNDQLYFIWTDFRDPGHNGDIYCKVIEWEDAIGVEPESEPVPLTFALHPPYPNPFNATTMITFTLPVAGEVELKVFDIQGRDMMSGSEAIPTMEFYTAGVHSMQFDGSELASGIYFIRMKAGNYTGIQKLVLLK